MPTPENPTAKRMRKPRPLRHPEHYQYDFNLADITEVWRRGSVVPPGCST